MSKEIIQIVKENFFLKIERCDLLPKLWSNLSKPILHQTSDIWHERWYQRGSYCQFLFSSQGQVSRFPFIFVMKYSWHIQIPKDENRVSWEGQRTRVKLGAVNVFLTLSNATLQDVNDATLRVTHTAHCTGKQPDADMEDTTLHKMYL